MVNQAQTKDMKREPKQGVQLSALFSRRSARLDPLKSEIMRMEFEQAVIRR